MPRELSFTKGHKCSRCGEPFEAAGKPVPGMKMMCRKCTKLVVNNQLQRRLLAEVLFPLEQEDKNIMARISMLLNDEKTRALLEKETGSLTTLTEKAYMIMKKRKKGLKELMNLQLKKK